MKGFYWKLSADSFPNFNFKLTQSQTVFCSLFHITKMIVIIKRNSILDGSVELVLQFLNHRRYAHDVQISQLSQQKPITLTGFQLETLRSARHGSRFWRFSTSWTVAPELPNSRTTVLFNKNKHCLLNSFSKRLEKSKITPESFLIWMIGARRLAGSKVEQTIKGDKSRSAKFVVVLNGRLNCSTSRTKALPFKKPHCSSGNVNFTPGRNVSQRNVGKRSFSGPTISGLTN